MRRRTRTRARSCSGKVQHEDRASALRHRAALIAAGAVRLTVYPCRYCRHWHVGHYA